MLNIGMKELNMFNFSPQPIFFELGFIKVHYYGFLITSAIILGFFVSVKLAKKYGLKKNQIIDLYFYLIIFGLIGARLYHVFCEWSYYSSHLLDIVKLWRGGLGIFGAIFAGLIVIWFYSKNIAIETLVASDELLATKIKPRANKFWLLLDVLSPALILGLALGRWGNYFNQELFGLPCNYFWCIPIELAHRPAEFVNSTHFHPTFLYESLACFTILIVLLIFHKLRLKNNYQLSIINYRVYKFYQAPGQIFLILILLYTFFRFFNEFLRLDPQPEFIGLRLSQWVSGGLFILSLTLLMQKYRSLRQMINDK